MKEKEPMVAGRDYGKDEDSAQVKWNYNNNINNTRQNHGILLYIAS
jgi:hypothetical protein